MAKLSPSLDLRKPISLAKLEEELEATKYNTHIARVDLSGQKLGEAGAEIVAKFLRGTTSVTTLNMMNCSLGDGGARILEKGLLFNRSVKYLNICGNKINFALIKTICRFCSSDRGMWSPEVHSTLPDSFKEIVQVLLLVHASTDSTLYPLPREMVYHFFEWLFTMFRM
eukprot:TRINITY_DN3976_c0_g1_i1.p2 TRINITY_DN3976_c0_g1~~TRINITY_DN3976_c0_g1_i1.p2  ORF type:complete len:169 (+),score=50.22 TRINITY_DN3976_c0_g1_i1:231-737(+)